jgi:hypothetical protein
LTTRSGHACGLSLAAALALAAGAAPAAAKVSRYIPATSRSFDYTFTTSPPAGIHVGVGKKDGALVFRRGTEALVRARMCESSSQLDPSGREAIRDEASLADARLHRLRSDVYRVGTQYWVAVRGGSCLRFSRASKAAAGLVRSLALRTSAQLGRRGAAGKSDPAGLALVRRTQAAAHAAERIMLTGEGGICSGAGLSCKSVARPGSVSASAAVDRPASYRYIRVDLPGLGRAAFIVREQSAWFMIGGQDCWMGPAAASDVDADELLTDEDLSLPTRSWKLRYGTPQARPDGTTAISWRGYWSRGVAIVGADGRLQDMQDVQRDEPRVTLSVHSVYTYPAAIEQVKPEPACPTK